MLNGNDLELLSAYLDGALTDQERADLEARLQTDAELRRELARLRATVDLVKTLPPLTAPRNFTLTRRTARRPGFVTSAAFSALSTAAAVILLVIGVALFSQRSFNNAAALALSTSTTRDEIAFAPTQTSQVEESTGALASPPSVLATVSTQVGAPSEVGGGVLPPVANNQPVPSSQKLDTVEAQAAQGDDQFNAFATGTSAPMPTEAPIMDALRFAAEPTTEAPENTQSRVDTDTETAQESADASAAIQAVVPSDNGVGAATAETPMPAPFAASGAAAAESPLPAPTLLPTLKPTKTLTPSPAPTITSLPTLTSAPTETDTPLPTTTLVPVSPAQPAPETNTVGIGLIVVALALFVVAIVTTVARRRR